MSTDARLTCARRRCIARALEASEHPERLAGRAAVAAALKDVKAALAAARGIDPAGAATVVLRAALERRRVALVDRLDALWIDDRRSVVAQVLALAALGRAAGGPVRPQARDAVRPARPAPVAPRSGSVRLRTPSSDR